MTDSYLVAIVIGLEALVVVLAFLLGYQSRRVGRFKAQVRYQDDKVSRQSLDLHDERTANENENLRDENARLLRITVEGTAP